MATTQLKSLLASLATVHAAVILKQADESLRQAAAMAASIAERIGRIEEGPLTALGRSTLMLEAVTADITKLREELARRSPLIATDVENRGVTLAAPSRERIVITDEMLEEFLRSESQRSLDREPRG